MPLPVIRPRTLSRYASRALLAALAVLLAACAAAAPTTPSRAPTATPTAATSATADAWAPLRQRPLQLPQLAPGAPCPKLLGHSVSPNFGPVLGDGPVYPDIGPDSANGTMRPGDLNKVLWIIAPTYTGPVLVRGHQVDGPAALTFNGGLDQATYAGDWSNAPRLPALRLIASAGGEGAWPNFPTYTNVPGPGCYGYQVDGVSFSYTLIFQAV